MTFNFLGPGLTVNVEAKVKEQIILDSSEYAQLIMASALADASVKAFQCSQQILENQLLPYKQLILKAAEKGLVRKRSASKFLLFCNFPTLSKVFVKSRNLLIVLRGIFFGKRKS